MPKTHRHWKVALEERWTTWDSEVEAFRRVGRRYLPPLKFPAPQLDEKASQKKPVYRNVWIEAPSCWVCLHRGLGDYARFALLRYLRYPTRVTQFDPQRVMPVSGKRWSRDVDKIIGGGLNLLSSQGGKGKLEEFNSQVVREYNRNPPATALRAERLQVLFQDKRLWPAVAQVANEYLGKGNHPGRACAVTADDVWNRRFAGPTAVIDFITFLNTGVVPPWQAPCADDLRDLGVMRGKKFERAMTWFPSTKRDQKLDLLVERLVGSETAPRPSSTEGPIHVSSLWSTLQPHGLIAACGQLIRLYQERCISGQLRRLPVVYVPVGLDGRRRFVSRRAVVRDVHRKLVIFRARLRKDNFIPRGLSGNPTGEEIDRAIGEIRVELAKRPTLIIFGIHHVTEDESIRPIEEEIYDSPLPYLIDRLLVDTGLFGTLHQPQEAQATQILILADGALQWIAHMPVLSIELPKCPAKYFPALLQWTVCPHLEGVLAELERRCTPLPNLDSNEVELSILEAALAMARRSEDTTAAEAFAARALGVMWDDESTSGTRRAERLLTLIVEYVLERARVDVAAAWFATLFHLVAVIPAGIRRFTAARVIFGYIMTTSADDQLMRPAWLRESEAELWRAPSRPPLRLSQHEVDNLAALIGNHIEAFDAQAAGLIRIMPAAHAPGFDEYPHPYESPEVPAFIPSVKRERYHLEFRSPFVRRVVCEQLERRSPRKHALVSRLMAEEFVRRMAIVQRHRADRDLHSLVDKRYMILALHQVLASLKFGAGALASDQGLLRLRWSMRPLTRVGTFHWVYRWLYVEQLNGHQQALSQRHGAEFLKRSLLETFLLVDPLRGRFQEAAPLVLHDSRVDLQHFTILTDILHGLVYVSVRTSSPALALGTFDKLEKLERKVQAALAAAPQSLEPGLRLAWKRALEAAHRQTTRLRLDAAVSYGAAFAASGTPSGDWRRLRLCRKALAALENVRARPSFQTGPVIRELVAAVRRAQHVQPSSWRLASVIRRIRPYVADCLMQHFYDFLVRYAELMAGSAEPFAHSTLRAARRTRALVIFELAEELRTAYAPRSAQEAVLALSPRPVRNAARVCLALGKYHTREARWPPGWYFERAAYYCFHVIGDRSQHNVERIALLIIEAMMLRIRGAGTQLDVALRVLKTAERALINFPDRIQLFMRFYLERAKVFCERAQQLMSGGAEFNSCVQYCRSDVDSVIRLAGEKRTAWRKRAELVLKTLAKVQFERGEGKASQPGVTGRRPSRRRSSRAEVMRV